MQIQICSHRFLERGRACFIQEYILAVSYYKLPFDVDVLTTNTPKTLLALNITTIQESGGHYYMKELFMFGYNIDCAISIVLLISHKE